MTQLEAKTWGLIDKARYTPQMNQWTTMNAETFDSYCLRLDGQ
jgi:hypothetical protein